MVITNTLFNDEEVTTMVSLKQTPPKVNGHSNGSPSQNDHIGSRSDFDDQICDFANEVSFCDDGFSDRYDDGFSDFDNSFSNFDDRVEEEIPAFVSGPRARPKPAPEDDQVEERTLALPVRIIRKARGGPAAILLSQLRYWKCGRLRRGPMSPDGQDWSPGYAEIRRQTGLSSAEQWQHIKEEEAEHRVLCFLLGHVCVLRPMQLEALTARVRSLCPMPNFPRRNSGSKGSSRPIAYSTRP